MTKASDALQQSVRNRPPFECIALVLQGGGALGAYQAGVYQALDEAGLDPDWISGSMVDHWGAGYDDTLHTLSHPEVLERPKSPEGVFIFDIAEHPRE
jgi:hypothetical protein